MKTILVLGAGLSSSSLIRYLLSNAATYNWKIQVVDQNIEQVKKRINGHPQAEALTFDALNPIERRPRIEKADLVISMLPARFHVEVAKDCIDLRVHLITPSYISKEMRDLHEKAKKAGVIIMNEIGVDPGIDHMSAMKIIDHINELGGEVTSFKSFCGGLIAPDSDNNPWHYKFTWNPRNVVLAGQGGAASFIHNGEYKFIPYNRLFDRLDRIEVPGYGKFEGYPNRDSLSYRETYGLEEIPTLYRGTLRRPNYCKGFHVFAELGMTDDSYKMYQSEKLTPRAFLNAFLPYRKGISVEEKFKIFLREDRMYLYDQFEWLGIFEKDETFGFPSASPAQLLEKLLVRKMSLDDNDKDMLVMYHEFEYSLNGMNKRVTSSMINIGEDQLYTAMSNTVGLPVGICAKMILTEKLSDKGVTLPVNKEVYEPILEELKTFNINFEENEYLIEA
jgi:saccharopine dehydrogenase-like NADP-dependent oxidoreductase